MNKQTKILVIDDDPLIRHVVAHALESIPSYNTQILEAASGAEGIALAQIEKPDLILLDIMMPGIDGYQVCQRLRFLEATSKTPIVMLTALDQVDAKIKGLSLGADDYLTKPFNLDELKARVMAHLRRYYNSTPEPPTPLVVFLCHSSGDKPAVHELYKRLLAEINIEPWLDTQKLLPGQNWELEIKKAVKASHVVIVCLSNGSINKEGYIQKEIRLALDVAEEKPDDTIFIIPLKLEECQVPDRLGRWHWVNYFEDGGYNRLIDALRLRASKLGVK